MVGTALAGWPLAAAAQPTMPAIGYLQSGSGSIPAAFHAGLKEAGFVEGQNVIIEYRRAEGQYDRLPELAADLISRRVAGVVWGGPNGSGPFPPGGNTPPPLFFFFWGGPGPARLVGGPKPAGGK